MAIKILKNGQKNTESTEDWVGRETMARMGGMNQEIDDKCFKQDWERTITCLGEV